MATYTYWGGSYWATDYWAGYWPEVVVAGGDEIGYWGEYYFPPSYWAASYWGEYGAGAPTTHNWWMRVGRRLSGGGHR